LRPAIPSSLPMMCSVDPTGHGPQEVRLELAGHRGPAQQLPDGRAERLVERAGQQPAVREAGRALVCVGDGELRDDRRVRPHRGPQA
jgi:hypothetical protein